MAFEMIYRRWLMMRLAVSTGIILASMAGIYSLFDFIEHVRIINAYDAPARRLIDLALFHLPTAIYHLFPLAVMFSALIVAAQIKRDLELAALCSIGQRAFRRLVPFLFFGMMSAMLTWILGDVFVPLAEREYSNAIDIEIKHKDTWGDKWRPHRFWHLGPGGVWRVGEGSGEKLSMIEFYRRGSDGKLLGRFDIRRMEWFGGKWNFEDAVEIDISDGSEKPIDGEKLLLKETPDHFRRIWASVEQMNGEMLQDVIDLKRKQGLDFTEFEVAYWLRYSHPMLCVVFALLAVVFAWRRLDSGSDGDGFWAMLGFGALLGLLCAGSIFAGRWMALKNWIPAIVGAFAPIALMLSIAIAAFKRYSKQ